MIITKGRVFLRQLSKTSCNLEGTYCNPQRINNNFDLYLIKYDNYLNIKIIRILERNLPNI